MSHLARRISDVALDALTSSGDGPDDRGPMLPSERAALPIVGASIPRSGHHHLSRLVRAYFGDALRYCPVYRRPDCCGHAPCTMAEGRRLTFQKSHDFTFRLAPDLPGAVYVIQHREPVANVLSAMELIARRRGMRRPDEGLIGRLTLYDFLARKLAYFRRFHDKWIVAPPKRALVVDYAELAGAPDAVLRRMALMVDGRADNARIADVVASLASVRGRGSAFVPRKVEASAFFRRSTLAAFETAVIDQCPAYGYAPTLEGRGYKRHPIWALAHLRYGFGKAAPAVTSDDDAD